MDPRLEGQVHKTTCHTNIDNKHWFALCGWPLSYCVLLAPAGLDLWSGRGKSSCWDTCFLKDPSHRLELIMFPWEWGSNFINHQWLSYSRLFFFFFLESSVSNHSLPRATAKTFPWNLVFRACIDLERPWFRVRGPAWDESSPCKWGLSILLLCLGEAGCSVNRCVQGCISTCHRRKGHVLENCFAYFSPELRRRTPCVRKTVGIWRCFDFLAMCDTFVLGPQSYKQPQYFYRASHLQ